ncbi:transposase, partial [Enterococcus avium]
CKTPVEEIQAAVEGAISVPQAIKLRQCLNHINEIEKHREEINLEIQALAEPFSPVLELLRTIPGLDTQPITAIAILSEIGPDMSVFPTSKHFISWAGCCPRNDRSARRTKSTRISRAGQSLKPLLVQIANALLRSKEHPEFKNRYRRIKANRGHKKAIIAICKMLLTAIWNVLSKVEPYSAKGYLEPKPAKEEKVLTQSQALDLLRKRGYTIIDSA